MLTDKNVELDYAKGRSRKKLQLIKDDQSNYLPNDEVLN